MLIKKNGLTDKEVNKIFLSDINWISATKNSEEMDVTVRVRYRQQMQDAHVYANEKKIVFAEPQTVSVGQSAVIYDKDEVIGGGVITRTAR